MTVKGYILLFTDLFLFCLSLGTARKEIVVLTVVVFSIGIFSLACAFFASLGLSIDTSLSTDRLTRLEKLEYRITLKGFVIFPAAITAKINSSCVDKPLSYTFQVMPGKCRNIFVCDFPCVHRGKWSIRVNKLKITDVFGFFLIPILKGSARNAKTDLGFTVDPIIYDIDATPATSNTTTGTEIVTSKPAENGEPYSDTRLYQPGDSMKRIHWIQTARLREIYVRRFEETKNQSVIVLMDCKAKEDLLDTADIATETAVSILNCYLEHTVPVRLICERDAGDISSTSVNVCDKESLKKASNVLTLAEFSEDSSSLDIKALGVQSRFQAGAVHIITQNIDEAFLSDVAFLRLSNVKAFVWVPTKNEQDNGEKPYYTVSNASDIIEKVGAAK